MDKTVYSLSELRDEISKINDFVDELESRADDVDRDSDQYSDQLDSVQAMASEAASQARYVAELCESLDNEIGDERDKAIERENQAEAQSA